MSVAQATEMLAAIAHPGEQELRLERVPTPRPQVGEVVVRVLAAGLTPGLIEFWRLGRNPLLPRTIGHEIAGTVHALGPGVRGIAIGDSVRVHANLTCRRCEHCLSDREQLCASCAMIGAAVFGPRGGELMALYPDGGLAEFIRVPEWLLDRMPEGIQPAVAAKVHDLANAWRALKLTGARPGATVIVTAATGAMGASIAILAPVAGIGRLVLVGRDRARLDAVGRLAGIPVAHVALGELGAWQDEDGLTRALLDRVPDGADAAIDFLPEGPGLSQAILALRPGGVAVTMAPNRQPPRVAIAALMSRCVTLIGSRNCTRSDARQVVALLDQGLADASPLITHRVPLTDVNRALEIVRDRREQPTWMCVVEPQPQEVIT